MEVWRLKATPVAPEAPPELGSLLNCHTPLLCYAMHGGGRRCTKR